MTPYATLGGGRQPTVTLYQGSCLEVLPLLPANSVHVCVTSPPYWGLRDYGTATWTGGDPACDHVQRREQPRSERPQYLVDGNQRNAFGGPTDQAQTNGRALYRNSCGRCGAVRHDQGIGNEAVPDCLGWATGQPCGGCWVCRLVAVFREVRRVLRDDGVMFLNVGDAFFSGNGTSRTSHRRNGSGGRACDTSGTTPVNSRGDDSSSSDLCDGCRAALLPHTSHSDTPPVHELAACADAPSPEHTVSPDSFPDSGDSIPPLLTAQSDHAMPGFPPAASHVDAPSLFSQESTTPQSLPQPPGVCSHCANCGACLAVLRSTLRDSRLCVRKKVVPSASGLSVPDVQENSARQENSPDIAETGDSCGSHTLDKASGSSSYRYSTRASHHPPLKPKDLCMLPARLALALQADGWWLRSEVIWHKLNPLPESVTDRPTKAHEQVYLLTKSPRYFYDAEAVRESYQSAPLVTRYTVIAPKGTGHAQPHTGDVGRGGSHATADAYTQTGRNLRSVWPLASEPFPGSHFATFPSALVRRCLPAACSAGGVCAGCGRQYTRLVERAYTPSTRGHIGKMIERNGNGVTPMAGMPRMDLTTTTTGFAPACSCAAGVTSAVCLDPFMGSGTVALVARDLFIRSIGVELNPAYCALAANRLTQGVLALGPGG